MKNTQDGKTVIRQDGGLRKVKHGVDKHPVPAPPKHVKNNDSSKN